MDVSGGITVWLYEVYSVKDCFKWSNRSRDTNKFETFPVVEVKDDLGKQLSE